MEYYNSDYLIHYGVKGMKWGVRRKEKYLAEERQSLINDAKSVKVKAKPGTHLAATSNRYHQKHGGRIYPAAHVVDEFGDVKISYIRGKYGDRILAAGKDYIDNNIKWTDYFKGNPEQSTIEYDVYK